LAGGVHDDTTARVHQVIKSDQENKPMQIEKGRRKRRKKENETK
jgi:hypothetical protein